MTPLIKTTYINALIFATFFLLACTSESLQISDLVFDDFDDDYSTAYNPQEALIKHQIDTMFLIADTNFFNQKSNETLWIYTYNENGKISETEHFGLGWTHNIYTYDSLLFLQGMQSFSDIILNYSMNYQFASDSLILHQYMFDIGHDKSSKLYRYNQLKFDKQGRILNKTYTQNNKTEYEITYKYNESGKIIYSETKSNDQTIFGYREYFYTNNKLDSIISTPWAMDGNDKIKLYYDERELCSHIISTTIRGDMMLNCVYKDRK